MTDAPAQGQGDRECDTTTMPMNIGQLYGHLTSGDILLPRFQRTLVWKRVDREDLLDSIHRGLPIGALLLHAVVEDHKTRYVLVDGLQRTIAIREYLQNRLSFMHLKALKGDALDNVCAIAVELIEGDETNAQKTARVEEALIAWIRSVPGLEPEEGLDAEFMADALKSSLALEASTDELRPLRDAGRRLVTQITKVTKIESYPLAVIVYKGERTQLAEIFKNINTRGAQLGRFDAYAADWVNYAASIGTKAIKDVVKNRWDSVRNKNLRVENWTDSGPADGYAFWEYMYGLGQHMMAKHPFLFGQSTAAGEDGTPATEGAPFYIAAVAHGLPPTIDGVGALPATLLASGHFTEPIDMSAFEKALFDACKFVEKHLNAWGGMKLNAADDVTSLSQIGELQVYSLVTRVMVGMYEPFTWTKRDSWKQEREAFESVMPLRYLVDVLQGQWSNAGDTKLFKATWDVPEGKEKSRVEDFNRSTWYTEAIDGENLATVLDVWLSDQLSRSQQSQRNVQKDQKLLLRYLYKDIPRDIHEAHTFHLDHLLPVARLAGLIESPDRWPISAVGNLALLDDKTNLQKTDKTMVEYRDGLTPAAAAKTLAAHQYAVICPIAWTDIPKDSDKKDHMSRDEYLAFLRQRQAYVKAKVLKSFGYDGEARRALDSVAAQTANAASAARQEL